MSAEQINSIQKLVEQSLAGELAFPDLVRGLSQLDVERYHIDYCRQEATYYLSSGESLVVSTPHPPQTIGVEFLTDSVAAAILQSQRGEHTYADFVRKTMDAGCVGYFVQITGQCAIYFGRRGESHREPFPTPGR